MKTFYVTAAHSVVEFMLKPSLLSSIPLVITRGLALKELICRGWVEGDVPWNDRGCFHTWDVVSKQGRVFPSCSFGHMRTQRCDVRSVCSEMQNKPTRGGGKDALRSVLFPPRSGVFAARTQRTNTANPTAATKRFDTCCLATGARRSLVSAVNAAASYLLCVAAFARRRFDREFILSIVAHGAVT